MEALLDVVKVEPSRDYKLHLEFENGEKRIFDMSLMRQDSCWLGYRPQGISWWCVTRYEVN